MNNFYDALLSVSQSLLGINLVQRLGWMLVHSVWQGAAVAIVLQRLLAGTRRKSGLRWSNLRYGFCCAAMLAIAASAIITMIVAAKPAPAVVPMTAGEFSFGSSAGVASINHPVASPIAPALAPSAPAHHFDWHEMIPILVVMWALGVIVLSGWQFTGWLRIQRLRWEAPLADSIWLAKMSSLQNLLHIRKLVRLVGSSRVQVPIVIGVFRPVIVVPLAILNELSAHQMEAILAHELGHIRRHDYLVNLIQTAIETIFFYHPAAWWISAQIRAERENCCDDIAVSACGNQLNYARALVMLEEQCCGAHRPALAATDGSLLQRVRRLLAADSPRRRLTRANLAALVMLIGVAMPIVSETIWKSRAHSAKAATPSTENADAANSGTANNSGATTNPASAVLAPGDLVEVSVWDLLGEGAGETATTSRIGKDGRVALPYIPPVQASGLTAAELEAATVKAYSEANLIHNARVAVHVFTDSSGPPVILKNPAIPSTQTGPAANEDKFAPGDVVVLSLTDLLGETTGVSLHICTIGQDGRMPVPLIPPIKAAGLSDSDLAAAINKAYADANLMKDAKASVSRDPRALLAGAAPAAGTQPSDKLAIGDVIALTLTDLNGEETGSSRHLLKIDKDGRIALPRLSAPVQAAGLSDSELEAEINKAYARSNLIRDAKASVSRHALDAQAGAPAGMQPSDKLAVGDNITVGIMELNTADQDNTKTYNIGRDGQISLPYIGRVQAAGLSPGDLEKEIAKAYVDGFFFRDPHVNVNQLVPPIPPSGVPAPAGLSASSVTFSASPATVPKGDLHPIAIIISKGGAISVDGSATTWGALRAKIEAMSKTDRATTYLALKAESGDLPVSDFFEQQAEAQKVVDDLGLAYVSVAGIQQKSDAPPPGGL